MRTLTLNNETKKNILNDLLKRSPNNYAEFEGRVNEIIANVREKRDAAIFEYTKMFDKADINASNVKVREDEIK